MKTRREFGLGISEVLGRRTLILGESGSGKTELAAKLVEELVASEGAENITVIDFAPEKTEHAGGRLTDYVAMAGGVRYLVPREVYAPRLTGASRGQVLRLARLNRKFMEPLLAEFVGNATEVLVVNDVTLYLHVGRLESVLRCARLAKTFLATAYYGSSLSSDLGTGISRREKRLTDELAGFMDRVVRMDR